MLLTYLSISFFICEMGIIVVISPYGSCKYLMSSYMCLRSHSQEAELETELMYKWFIERRISKKGKRRKEEWVGVECWGGS